MMTAPAPNPVNDCTVPAASAKMHMIRYSICSSSPGSPGVITGRSVILNRTVRSACPCPFPVFPGTLFPLYPQTARPVPNGKILVKGVNSVPKGIEPCTEETCIRKKLQLKSGERQELCFIVPAEQRTLYHMCKNVNQCRN